MNISSESLLFSQVYNDKPECAGRTRCCRHIVANDVTSVSKRAGNKINVFCLAMLHVQTWKHLFLPKNVSDKIKSDGFLWSVTNVALVSSGVEAGWLK